MPSRTKATLLALCLTAACAPAPGPALPSPLFVPPDAGASVTGDGAFWPEQTQGCTQPRSQTLSQPCCTEWGADACGANLFCAAFDGRTQPTCYPERSRLDRTECKDDGHCVSGDCNLFEQKCQSLPRAACDPRIGCARGPDGARYGCSLKGANPVCERLGDGSAGSFCVVPGDCESGICQDERCVGAVGALCRSTDPCADGKCEYCSNRPGHCDQPGQYQCLPTCWDQWGTSPRSSLLCPAPPTNLSCVILGYAVDKTSMTVSLRFNLGTGATEAFGRVSTSADFKSTLSLSQTLWNESELRLTHSITPGSTYYYRVISAAREHDLSSNPSTVCTLRAP